MNAREVFLSIMNFQKCDRNLLWEYCYWAGTLERWYKEGLPRKTGLTEGIPSGKMVFGEALYWPDEWDDGLRDKDVHSYFGLDEGFIRVPVKSWIYPPFEREVLEVGGDNVVERNEMGMVRKIRKDGASAPQFLAWSVKNQQDFEKIKEKLNPDEQGRFPQDWDDQLKKLKNRTFPLVLGGHPCGFFGSLRYLMGIQNLSLTYYDNPMLIHYIIHYLTDFWIDLWSKVLSQVRVDCVHLWEDMCYSQGSLISPDLFRKFMMPAYKRLVGFIKENGVKSIFVDTDGDCSKLIPLFLECGITGLYPFEVQSIDIVKIRKEFPYLQMMGGISLEKEKVDIQMEKKLSFLLRSGRYIPCADNIILPDIPWEKFKRYRQLVEKLIRT